MSISQNAAPLVIFDLDGVIVDAQGAETRALQTLGRSMGVELSDELADDLFSGKRLSACIEQLEELADAPAPGDATERVRTTCEQILRATLRPVPGIEEVLDQLDLHMCIASNSPVEIIRSRLEATGLAHYFGNCLYSAYDIGSWKPDPNLFLWAAASCGFRPDHCVVIEDSMVGVQAAISAEIPVMQYSALTGALELGGITAFYDMKELPALLDSHFRKLHH